ncbi:MULTISPECIES: hypothetical protein [Nonomuraea]|uniref:Zinc-ribbon domain-containing protein n=2 Tax=Nonomuraea TaxID=83681 RepID=A0ABW1C412_9ACTN|nr:MULTISPECIES: hypothetical protein [Nonomuraea]MDA0639368.1 hypothetical protein [Nonomuraea ferruginea]TXK39684.1 hypothetical protein FR742_08815 [Nonomuraea sp. C10]
MHEGTGGRRLWPLECLRCWHVWEEAYTVRLGDRGEIWLMGGVVVQPPWSGACCPACGGFAVTSFPDGYLARHPELLSSPEPEPERPRVPDPDPVPVAAGRTPRHHRLLVVLGVPAVLVAAYEVYRVMAAARPH